MKEEINFDEEERAIIEQRLDVIFSLKRKYGNSIQEILKYKNDIKQEIYEIENIEQINNDLRKKLAQTKEKMLGLANQMNKIRNIKAKELSEKVKSELIDLEMKNAKFSVKVDYNENRFNKN